MNKLMSSVTAIALLLVGCGGSNSSSSSNTPPTTIPSPNGIVDGTPPTTIPSPMSGLMGVGYYVDSAVEGVDYNCGNKSGVTNKAGMFEFERGEDCKFSLGYYTLREVKSSDLKDNIFVIEDNVTIARLLQTLDKDGNASNGIQLLEDTAEILMDTHIDGTPTEDALLDTVRENLKAHHQDDYNGRVVSREEAEEHINQTKALLDNNGSNTQYSQDNNILDNNVMDSDDIESDMNMDDMDSDDMDSDEAEDIKDDAEESLEDITDQDMDSDDMDMDSDEAEDIRDDAEESLEDVTDQDVDSDTIQDNMENNATLFGSDTNITRNRSFGGM